MRGRITTLILECNLIGGISVGDDFDFGVSLRVAGSRWLTTLILVRDFDWQAIGG